MHADNMFYNNKEKRLMLEILISAIYITNDHLISQHLNDERFYDTLINYIVYFNQDKMLTQRSLYLLINIFVEIGSDLFWKLGKFGNNFRQSAVSCFINQKQW